MWVKANGGAMLSDDGKTAQLNDPKMVEALATTAGIVQASGGWNRLKSLRDSLDFFGAKNPAAACQFAKTMTEASTWVAAAEARVAARAKKHLPFTGLYSGNKVADEQIFGEIYKPADNPKFDDAVQTVLGSRTWPSPPRPRRPGPSSRRPGRTGSTGC
jgi:multiple sugar transport system substrate-binding protein